jgi:molecular chaperone GrpE (heat shock protein)
MSVEKKILEELARYNRINKYISEQEEVVPPPPGDVPPPPPAEPEGAIAPPPEGGEVGPPAEVIDVETDKDVEKIDDKKKEEEEESTEELDITDLVKSQENIEKKQKDYFEDLFKQLEELQNKVSEMSAITDKLNQIENKIEKYRPRTPEEKLELRSLDSGPFNQKLTDFFQEKEDDFEKTGKEYVLTSDEVSDFTDSEVKDTFNTYTDDMYYGQQNQFKFP